MRIDTGAAYAVYFDYKRRNDPEFRKALKRESRRQARIAKEEAEIQGKKQREEVKRVVQEAIEEGFPTDIEEKEAFFMQQIAQGEALAGDGMHTFQATGQVTDLLQVRTQSALLSASTKA